MNEIRDTAKIINDERANLKTQGIPYCERCAHYDSTTGEFTPNNQDYTKNCGEPYEVSKGKTVIQGKKVHEENIAKYQCTGGHKVAVCYNIPTDGDPGEFNIFQGKYQTRETLVGKELTEALQLMRKPVKEDKAK